MLRCRHFNKFTAWTGILANSLDLAQHLLHPFSPAMSGMIATLCGLLYLAWLPEALEYVRAHQAELKRVPLALFCVHIMNLGEDGARRKKRLAYLAPVRKLVSPASEAFFAGMGMDPETTSFVARWAFKLFNGGEASEGDNRDWTGIRAWARQIQPLLAR